MPSAKVSPAPWSRSSACGLSTVCGAISDHELSRRREAGYRLLEEIEVVEPTRTILARASLPLPTPIGTLDAIHLATAMLWRESSASDLTFATHDSALGIAARANGFRVVGT